MRMFFSDGADFWSMKSKVMYSQSQVGPAMGSIILLICTLRKMEYKINHKMASVQ